MALSKQALWFRDKFEGQFNSRELLKDEVNNFFVDLAELIKPKAAATLPPEFFDLGRSARMYARREGISVEDAREKIIERAEILVHLYDLPVAGNHLDDGINTIEATPHLKGEKKHRHRSKILLVDADLYKAVLAFRKAHNGKNPGSNDNRQCLPPNSLGWSSIAHVIRARGETLGDFINRMDAAARQEQQIDASKLPVLRASEIFEACANSIQQNKCLPQNVGEHPTSVVNQCLRHDKVLGLSQFISAAAPTPRKLCDFAVATGLAAKEGNRLIIPHPDELQLRV